MSDLTFAIVYTTSAPLDATLWHCARCNALVSIQSAHPVIEPFCPACIQAPLEFCGTFNGIPGLYAGNA